MASDVAPPAYRQIAEALRKEIVARSPGDHLPPEQELADRFRVNRHTLRRALDTLEDDGLVVRQQGRRARILCPPLNHSITRRSDLTQELDQIGVDAEVEVLATRIIQPPPLVAGRLKLRKPRLCFMAEILLMADGAPIAYAEHYLPARPYAEAFRGYTSGTVCQHFARHVGEPVERSRVYFRADLPDERLARLLLTANTRPIALLSSLNVLQKSSKPVEYAIHYFRADAIELTTGF